MPFSCDESSFYVEHKPKYKIFHELMAKRINNVLLVSSRYDSFILEEDGRLSDQIYEEFQNLNLRTLPKITQVSSANEALELFQQADFDLVITMQRLGSDVDVFSFGKSIKAIRKEVPVVLLLNTVVEIKYLPDREEREGIDRVFVWNGDSKIFVAIIKHLEDEFNVKHDTELGLVRVIIYVEDSIRYYSLILPELYSELMKQTHRLLTEGANDFQDLLQMRARPKILLAETFEEALEYYEKYKDYVLGVISDIEFPKNSKLEKEAGCDLVKKLHTDYPNLPIILQSRDLAHKTSAEKLGTTFLSKTTHRMLFKLRKWMMDYLGFGDFIFKMPNGKIIARAKDVFDFYRLIGEVPIESLEYHGTFDQFSRWLMVRGEFLIANQLKNRKVSEFTKEGLRNFIREIVNNIVIEKTRGIINDFSRENYHPDALFVRLRPGSLGGKARGLAFLMMLLNSEFDNCDFPNVEVQIPKTIVIGTNEFDQFMESNNMYEIALSDESDEKLRDKFVKTKLTDSLKEDLEFILKDFTGPIAVRSSSLLEDSSYQPFSGIFSTYMLPNNHPDIKVRLKQLCKAIKLVYSSPFTKLAKTYAETLGQIIEESKMAVVIQKVVGKEHGDRFYPDFSGTASSYNYYPFATQMKPEDRVAHLALGLGKTIVDGGLNLRFCPKYPTLIRSINPKILLYNSQNEFFAINLNQKVESFEKTDDPFLSKFDLDIATSDDSLKFIADTFDYDENMLKSGFTGEGYPVITFNQLLNSSLFALPELITRIMEMGEQSMGCSVEIEFAGNFSKKPDDIHNLYILQIRPFLEHVEHLTDDIEEVEKEKILLHSVKVSGNILRQDIQDIIFIKPDNFSKMKTFEMRDAINKINSKLVKENKPYILIGIGRWGSKDRYLGVPVKWQDINGAKVMVEANLKDFQIDFSQGSHFFQNIVTANIGYFHINYGSKEEFIDWDWLEKQKVVEDSEYIKHIRTKKPLTVRVNGRERIGTIIKPE